MKPTAHAVSAVAITLTFGLVGLTAGCGGDDTGGSAGAGGSTATGDASLDARGGMGGMGGASGSGGVAGAGGSGGTAVADGGPASDGQGMSDATAEPPPPFMTQILYDFLPVDAGGNVLGWAPTPANTGSAVVIASDDQAPDSPTAGSLELRGVFPPPDATGSSLMTAEVNFGDPTSAAGVRDFTGASTFHFWVRVVSPPSALRALQPFVQGGSLSSYSGTYQPYVTNIDNAWHEYQVPVAGQFYLNGVWKLGIQFFAPTPPMSDAGAAEVDATEVDATEVGDGESPEEGEVGSPEASADVAIDAGTAVDADSSAINDAGALDATDEDASTTPDVDAGSAEEAAAPDGGAAAPGPVIVHIDYVWVN